MSLCDYLAQIKAVIEQLEQAYGCGSNSSVPNQQRFRPKIPAGASMIALGSTACTFSAWAIKKSTGKKVMVVANHCGMAGSQCETVPPGTVWVQPSPMDGGTEADHVAVRSSTPADLRDPTIDALELDPDSQDSFTNEIVGQGTIDGKAYSVNSSEAIFKSGRTTGPGQGTVSYPSSDVNINYGPCGTLTKRDTIIASMNLQGGDSGDPATVVRNGKRLIVGEWVAGGSGLGVAMKIKPIEDKYGLDFDISQAPPPPPSTSLIQYSVDGGPYQDAKTISVQGKPSTSSATVSARPRRPSQ